MNIQLNDVNFILEQAKRGYKMKVNFMALELGYFIEYLPEEHAFSYTKEDKSFIRHLNELELKTFLLDSLISSIQMSN
jgi:hypothetical protein